MQFRAVVGHTSKCARESAGEREISRALQEERRRRGKFANIWAMDMYRDVSSCNTYNYGDAVYWDARYVHEAGAGAFDWYQRYSGLRPFVRKHIPTSSRILMVGCGNALSRVLEWLTDSMLRSELHIFQFFFNSNVSDLAGNRTDQSS
ncbi:hypothetical protein ACLOJK_025284 [Asimina triloba]